MVGTVQDPLHFSSDSESSTVGDGQLDCILFVPEGTLTADYYTVCYIKQKTPDCMIIIPMNIRPQWMP